MRNVVTKSWLGVLGLLALTGAVGCGSSSSSGGSSGTRTTLKFRMTSSAASNAAAFGFAPVSDTNFLNTSIGSGAAQEMTVKVTKMVLGKSDDSSVNLTIFNDTSGKAVTVRGSSVDISGLFTTYSCIDTNGNPVSLAAGETCPCGIKADGSVIAKVSMTLPDGSTGLGCPELAAGEEPPLGVMTVDQTGTYDQLTVTYQNLGQMKGCVTGKYKSNAADNTGTSATNCTKSGKGLDSGLATTTTDFPSSGAENMNVYLNRMGAAGTSEFQVTYKIPTPITLDATSSPTLTFLVDTGRMLRFYNANTNFSTPGPDYTSYASKAFFFTTLFESSSYIFVGNPGSVRGYRWATYARNWTGSTAPTDHICADGSTNCKYVAGWMTIILDDSGSPLLASLMPDDDNALTVLKGATTTSTGALDSTAIVQTSSTDWTINFRLGTELTGAIDHFNPSIAVSGSSDTTMTVTSQAGNSWGEVSFVRKL